jgi:hypothetical protein
MEYKSLENADLTTVLFASNDAGGSATWSTKTPQEILEDVSALLSSTWANSANEEWCPLANGGVPINGEFVPPDLMWPPRDVMERCGWAPLESIADKIDVTVFVETEKEEAHNEGA